MATLKQCFFLSLLLILALPAKSDDQEKAQKLLNKVTAMATDLGGKRAVSRAVADTLGIGRSEVVGSRSTLDLNYGDVFLLYKLVKGGAKMDEMAEQIKHGETIWQIAADQHADWKQIANDAKKLNGKLDDYLLKHFSARKEEIERDMAEQYDPLHDTTKADGHVSQQDLEGAQKRYAFLHDHAGVTTDTALDTSTERALRTNRPDPVREGGPNNPDTNTRPAPRN